MLGNVLSIRGFLTKEIHKVVSSGLTEGGGVIYGIRMTTRMFDKSKVRD